MRRQIAIVAAIILNAVATAPALAEPATATSPTGTVMVFAAASLTAAFQAIADGFEKTHPNVKIQFNFAGSSTLVQQIHQGAPADIFASADEANMQKLVDGGAIAGTPQIFAQNRLQIAVAAGNPKEIGGLTDLTKSGLTIALCGSTVPCGRYAAEAFAKAGVTPPAASQELDVKAVLNKVAMGEADAGVVYVTDVRAAGTKITGVDIPESSNVIARYPIALLKNGPNATTAAAFVAFATSSEGQRLLMSFGFLAP